MSRLPLWATGWGSSERLQTQGSWHLSQLLSLGVRVQSHLRHVTPRSCPPHGAESHHSQSTGREAAVGGGGAGRSLLHARGLRDLVGGEGMEREVQTTGRVCTVSHTCQSRGIELVPRLPFVSVSPVPVCWEPASASRMR